MATINGYLTGVIAEATPSDSARNRASSNRTAIESWLKQDLDAFRIFETGSWSHGTAATPWSDVDYFASMSHSRPRDSASDLELLRRSLSARFSSSAVHIDRPAVRVPFWDSPDVEITPAHLNGDGDYFIPDPHGAGWIKSNPIKHNQYVNDTRDEIPDAKKFIRLVKVWNRRRIGPISSLYLEMRAAKYLRENKPFSLFPDLVFFFRHLQRIELADMNDPSTFDGRRITPCTSFWRSHCLEAVGIASRAADLAFQFYLVGDDQHAVESLEMIFGS